MQKEPAFAIRGWKSDLFFGGAGELACQGAEGEGQDVYRYDGGAYRGAGEDGNDDPGGGAGDGDDRRKDRHAFEAAEQPHGRKGREDHQRGDQQGADQVHRQDDNDGDDDRDQQIIAVRGDPGGLGEGFIKGHGENLMIKEDEDQHHERGKHSTQDHFAFGERQDGSGTEQGAAHIPGKVRRCGENVHDQVAQRHRPDGDHGNGRVAFDLGVLPGPQQQDRGKDRDRQHQQHFVGQVENRRDGHGAEGHMRKAVPDE